MEIKFLADQFKSLSILEWLGVCFGIAEVLLAKANKIWLYPTGIVAVCISIYIFWETGLYAESLLNFYYLGMSVYGWWVWIYKRGDKPLPITRSTVKEWQRAVSIIIASYLLLLFALKKFTDSSVPMMDAFVSATAWAGMWLLAKRKIENWILLNISNAVAIPLLFYKELPLYGMLTIFLFVIAILGYFDWKKKLYVPKKD